jgi:hypothetical protein
MDDPAFMSTTTDKGHALRISEGSTVIRMEVPAGSRGIFMPNADTGFPEEMEFLLPRGTKLEVVRVIPKKEGWPTFIETRVVST